MKVTLITAAIAAVVALSGAHAETVSIDVSKQALDTVLQQLHARSGAEFKVAQAVAGDLISRSVYEDGWRDAVENLLAGYNYETVWAADGQLRQVIVSGRNGSDTPLAESRASGSAAGGEALLYEAVPAFLPAKYQRLNPGSVMPVSLPLAWMKSMGMGEKISLNLPSGQFDVVHDNLFQHDNGDVTWVGYLESAGTAYRMIVTMGGEGIVGQVVTPDGVYNLESEGGRTWLLDVNAAGLLAGELAGDQVAGIAPGEGLQSEQMLPIGHGKAQKVKISRVVKPVAIKHKSSLRTPQIKPTVRKGKFNAATASANAVVDLLILYTPGMAANKSFDSRLNYLVDRANQAYIDSKIKLSLRVVAKLLIDYSDANANDQALSDLSAGQDAFATVADLRKRYAADLVTLIRPFNYQAQVNCGSAWVNGANGGALTKDQGFSVVSDGTDSGGSAYYCSDYTLAHELGHNMGSVHDRQHSDFPGKFPYSYGYGVAGQFGDIMSYYNPVLGYFSSPNLSYHGQPLGKADNAPDAADNVTSLNLTAPLVANFLPAVQ